VGSKQLSIDSFLRGRSSPQITRCEDQHLACEESFGSKSVQGTGGKKRRGVKNSNGIPDIQRKKCAYQSQRWPKLIAWTYGSLNKVDKALARKSERRANVKTRKIPGAGWRNEKRNAGRLNPSNLCCEKKPQNVKKNVKQRGCRKGERKVTQTAGAGDDVPSYRKSQSQTHQ